ncbi:hypothetical protein TH61_09290 [Rufibacter sp. DG15C]|uniref:hypothetical protein n=1 Tax=Rufibacter sp. DG15C TaxID=1379909 RepID=UPI00078DC743|nr:hypothetical protein [Rufibacter sp. DG15C]AMM51328.1 hypothetical protein TH61_09290 [Rufibacter sp. DG15C]
MRKLLNLLWLLAAPFLMAACGDEEEPAPAPHSELSAVVQFSRFTNQGYLPVGRTNEMKVYSGDTIRYFFGFNSNQGIKDFKVYDNLRGREFPLMVQTKATSKANGVTSHEYELEYVVDSHAQKTQPGQEIILTVEPQHADGSIYQDPATGKPCQIKFTLAAPLVYTGARLYNYWGRSSNSLVIFDLGIANHPPQSLVDEKFLSAFAFLTNKMPPRNWYDNRFEASFTSGPEMGEGKVAYVKVLAVGKDWYQPNQIAQAMKQYGPETTTVLNAQVGDVYAFKVRYPLSNSWVIYGLMEVKNIVDDHDTTSGNGHDEDYLEFDIKYFPGYRY